MTWQLQLDDLNQAKALHGMLMDRKFEGPHDKYFGSPFIASVQRRLADIITAAEPGKDWAGWLRADHHPHRVQQIRQFLQHSTAWPTMPQDTRRQFVQDLLAPLILSVDLLQELVDL